MNIKFEKKIGGDTKKDTKKWLDETPFERPNLF